MSLKKFSALVLATAVSATLASPLSTPASADARVITGNLQESVHAEQIDPQHPVTLFLRKIPANPYDEVPSGELPPGLVTGVEFSLSQVNETIVTTSDGYNVARGLTLEQARERGVTPVATVYTDDQGTAIVGGLKPGVYLVEETPPNDPSREYKTSSPFLVLLPLGVVDGTGFDYESTVVVKNSEPNKLGTTTPIPPPPLSEKPGEQPRPGFEEPTPEPSSVPPVDYPRVPPIEDSVPGSVSHPVSSGSTGTVRSPGATSANAPSSTQAAPGSTRSPIQRLAETGASVILVAVVGLLLVLAGAVLLLRRRN